MADNVHPLVTIAIPTYNRANTYLKQSLESAVNQTYQNIEIIVSDNCSKDNTETVVMGYNDPRIRYFRHKVNIGANNNFNFCLEQAKGDYFLILQDDDLIDNDFVDTCMKDANYSTDVGIIRTGTRWIDPDGNLLLELPNRACGLSTEDFFMSYFKGKTGMYLCSTLFNTKTLREIGGFHSKHNLFQDVMAEIRLAFKYGRQDFYEIKASNRKHQSEMTFSTKINSWCEESLALIDLMCEYVSENKTLLRTEGMAALSQFNYTLTRKIKSPLKSCIAYLIVFQKFKYKYLPPPARRLIYNNPFFRGARYIKRKLHKNSRDK